MQHLDTIGGNVKKKLALTKFHGDEEKTGLIDDILGIGKDFAASISRPDFGLRLLKKRRKSSMIKPVLHYLTL